VLKENGYRVGGVGKFDLHKPSHWWGLDGLIEDLETLGFTKGVDNAGKIEKIWPSELRLLLDSSATPYEAYVGQTVHAHFKKRTFIVRHPVSPMRIGK
jgi:hypothetical protein